MSESAGFLPPFRPLALAASNPAFVLSRIKFRSNDYFASRYSYIREFAPHFLDALKFQSNKADDPLITALELIRELNTTRKRKVPEEAPLAFIPQSWLDYVLDEKDRIVRRYYEISALWELRGGLRSGDIWVKNSRKYANLETYLIPKDQWPTIRPETLRLLGLPETGEERLEQRKAQLQKALNQFDNKLSLNDDVKIETGNLVISPLKAEDLPPSSVKLRELVDQRLPLVDLTDLLIEVDGWTNFTDCFEHPTGHQPRTIDLLTHLFASILANACNFGLAKMAQSSDLTYDQLAWCNNFCLGFTPHPKVLVKPRRQLVSA